MHLPAIKLLSSCFSAHFEQGKKNKKKLPPDMVVMAPVGPRQVNCTAPVLQQGAWEKSLKSLLSFHPAPGWARWRKGRASLSCQGGVWAGRDLCVAVNPALLQSILNTPDKLMDAAAGGKELVSSWKVTFNTHKVLSF